MVWVVWLQIERSLAFHLSFPIRLTIVRQRRDVYLGQDVDGGSLDST